MSPCQQLIQNYASTFSETEFSLLVVCCLFFLYPATIERAQKGVYYVVGV